MIILCTVLVFAFLYFERRNENVKAVILKGLASSCFVITGLILSPGTGTAELILAGLLSGCIADIVMELKKVFVKKAHIPFLIGCLFFFAGHILYLAGIFPASSHKLICVAAAVILTPPVMVWTYSRITAKPALKVIGVIYIGTVMLLNSTAIGNLIEGPSAFTGIFAAGALMFLVSDILLILNSFGAEYSQKMKNTHIGLYYAGQMLIALSLQYLA